MKTKKEFETVKKQVEKLLEDDERCRNDDKWLTYKVMRHYTNIYINFNDFSKLPSFETVKRVRAKIQNEEKKWLPTDLEVRKKRSRREKEVSDWSVGK